MSSSQQQGQRRRAVVRSYQRVFRPDRRIYAIDGRTIPVPGGVPLRWLAHAAAVLAAVAVLAGHRPTVAIAGAGLAYLSAARLGRRREALSRAAATGGALTIAGWVVRVLDWPSRYVVLPAVAATVLTQVSPDGRSVHRHLISLAQVRIAGRRRLGQPLPHTGRQTGLVATVRVASDGGLPDLARGRITGPCRVRFAEPVVICRRRNGHARIVPAGRARRGVMVESVALAAGQRMEVAP